MARVHSNKKSKQSRNHHKSTPKTRNIRRTRAQAALIGVAEARTNAQTSGLPQRSSEPLQAADVYQHAMARALNALHAFSLLPFKSLRVWQALWFPIER